MPRHKSKDSMAWFMDCLALGFLGRFALPLLSESSDYLRVSYVLLLFWLILAVMPDRGKRLWKAMKYSKGVSMGLLVFSAWLIGEALIKRSADASINWPILLAGPLYVLACYYGYHHSARFWRILWILVGMLGIQAAYSLPNLIAGTWAPRIVMHGVKTFGQYEGRAFILEAARHGVGGYALYSNNAIIAMIAVGTALGIGKRMAIKRLFWMLVWGVLVLANTLSTFTASAQVVILGSIVLFVCAITMRRMTTSSVLVLLLVAGVGGWAALERIRGTDSYQFAFNKSINIFSSVKEGGLRNENSGRGELLYTSWDAIVKSPLVGQGTQGGIASANRTSIGGGHSTWLNMLVFYGLAGSVWCFVMVVSVGRQIWLVVKMRPGDLLAVSFMVAYACFLVYGIINTIAIDMVFFFVLYGGALALQRHPRVLENGYS